MLSDEKPRINAESQLLSQDKKQVNLETSLFEFDVPWWRFFCLSILCPGIGGLLINKRIHGEFKISGLLMIVGLVCQWAAIALFVIQILGYAVPVYCVAIPFTSVLLLLVLFIRQRKQFLFYQQENQALPHEESRYKTCMTVWVLWSCSHGQMASATEKLKTVQTV